MCGLSSPFLDKSIWYGISYAEIKTGGKKKGKKEKRQSVDAHIHIYILKYIQHSRVYPFKTWRFFSYLFFQRTVSEKGGF